MPHLGALRAVPPGLVPAPQVAKTPAQQRPQPQSQLWPRPQLLPPWVYTMEKREASGLGQVRGGGGGRKGRCTRN